MADAIWNPVASDSWSTAFSSKMWFRSSSCIYLYQQEFFVTKGFWSWFLPDCQICFLHRHRNRARNNGKIPSNEIPFYSLNPAVVPLVKQLKLSLKTSVFHLLECIKNPCLRFLSWLNMFLIGKPYTLLHTLIKEALKKMTVMLGSSR